MGTPKVCKGCFSEWEEGWDVCPYCGFNPKRLYSEIFSWKTGDILEKRYLVGEIFCRIQDVAVWRFYDHVMGIPCLVLRKRQNIIEELYPIARKLSAGNIEEKRDVEILSVKTIEENHALIFSMKDRYKNVEELKELLISEDVKVEKEERQIEEQAVCVDTQGENPLLPETCLDGRYRIKGCIGIGGFGITYLCEDILLHRDVAVKEYFPGEWAERDGEYVAVKASRMVEAYKFGMQSFFKEVRITAKFIHASHIVTVYDAIEANDTAYMVLEYIEGLSIGREMRAKNYKPYTPAEMADVIFPVLDGLEEIHSQRIVHSDISPGNIMRSTKGRICLIDLGAAKYNLESQPVLSAAFLKIDYAAPEQYRTAKEGIPKSEGPWTDLYGLGAVMYYMLTGHKPADVISRLSSKSSSLVPPRKYGVRLPKKWMKLIYHAMSLEIKERFHSAAECRDEIRKLLE